MPFRVDIAASELDHLHARLARTRWPTELPVDGWAAGSDRTVMRRLTTYWAGGYDWRQHEAVINELPQYTAEVDGTVVHFLHFRGERADALPLVMTHGWPGSFLEMVKIAPLLANPSAHGRSNEIVFDVVVPSLPGYLFSEQRPTLCSVTRTSDLWAKLMCDVLGYDRFGAHGGDLGAGVSTRLGAEYPDRVAGIHVLAVSPPHLEPDAELTDKERAYLRELEGWDEAESGYQHEQSTRPLTLAYGLSDSPVGLLAWLLEKYRNWSDCSGDVSTRFTDDEILTQVSLYWFTNTIASSFRPYYEYQACSPAPVQKVSTPTGVAVFPGDLSHPPRSWCERVYNVVRYTTMPRGGHFAAHEEPHLLADDLVAFFGALDA